MRCAIFNKCCATKMVHFRDSLTLLFSIHEHDNDAVYNNAQPTRMELRSSHSLILLLFYE